MLQIGGDRIPPLLDMPRGVYLLGMVGVVLFSKIGAICQSFSLVLGGSSELLVAEGGFVLSLLMPLL